MKKYFIYKSPTVMIELFRYLLVGGFAFILDFSTLYVLVTFFSLHYLVANVFAFVIGLGANYILSVRWVFAKRKKEDAKHKEMILFALIGVAGLVINQLVLWVGIDILVVSLVVAKIVATAIVFIWNFLIRKIVLF